MPVGTPVDVSSWPSAGTAVRQVPDDLRTVARAMNMGKPGKLIVGLRPTRMVLGKRSTEHLSAHGPDRAESAARGRAVGNYAMARLGELQDAPAAHSLYVGSAS